MLQEVSQAMDDPSGRKPEAELGETIQSNKMQLTRSTIEPIHLHFLNNRAQVLGSNEKKMRSVHPTYPILLHTKKA